MTDHYEGDPIDDPVLGKLVEMEDADKLEPELIVAEATDPSSPLHGQFEWDDSVAAHQHRLAQARQLVARYKVVKVEPSGDEVRYRRFTHVPSAGRYESTERALVNHRDEIMARARRDLRTWELKYQRLGRASLMLLATEALDNDAAA